MDSNYRLKIKIGSHEFDAEGPADVVNSQFQAFKELVASVPVVDAAPRQPATETKQEHRQDDQHSMSGPDEQLAKIMKVDGRVVSLTSRAKSVDDAVLLILYGQRVLREADLVTGGDIMSGITDTGGFSVGRVDRLLEKAGRAGDVIIGGEHRRKRYRLSNTGLAKARAIANDLIALVP